MHPRQRPVEPEIEAVWIAAVDDAGLDSDGETVSDTFRCQGQPVPNVGRSIAASAKQPPRACKFGPKPGERNVPDAFIGLRRRDSCAPRDHELEVAAAVGEDQVAGAQAGEADRSAGAELVPRRARDPHADRAVRRVDQARTVEARSPRSSTPVVGDADLVASAGPDRPEAGSPVRGSSPAILNRFHARGRRPVASTPCPSSSSC